jgi:hypothetical protein
LAAKSRNIFWNICCSRDSEKSMVTPFGQGSGVRDQVPENRCQRTVTEVVV